MLNIKQELQSLRKAADKICQSQETARAYLVKHGFVNPDGSLTDKYSSEKFAESLDNTEK